MLGLGNNIGRVIQSVVSVIEDYWQDQLNNWQDQNTDWNNT